jgi:biotin carboxyl carrier protein
MKFRARLGASGERAREIEIADDGRMRELALDGVSSLYDSVAVAPSRWSLIGPDGAQAEVSVGREADGTMRVQIGAFVFRFEFLDELTARALAATGGGSSRRAADLRAAIPGRVLRVLVGEGDHVEPGQTLVVLEAMKMENEVRAPRAGRIQAIDVSGGQAVGAGDVLVRFAED